MERHECKLCSKNFSNGRALGGHMRSHLLHLPASMPVDGSEPKLVCHTDQSVSSASSSSSSEEEEGGGEGEVKDQCYGLRENPKKSVRLADPEFSFAGSVVLQDRESETESSKNPTRRRSKRFRKTSPARNRAEERCCRVEQEPVSSSISDAATEEDVAFCLMMLSRDRWRRRKRTEVDAEFAGDEDFEVEEEEEEDDEDEETDETEELVNCKVMADKRNSRTKGRYRCETCNKTFRSYQALGGHRASHKKAQLPPPSAIRAAAHPPSTAKGESVKVHECPYCSRVFASGQALGGHKRSHTTNYGATITVPILGKKPGATLIDLNLPAPVDDDDLVELSAVSDAEYLYHSTR